MAWELTSQVAAFIATPLGQTLTNAERVALWAIADRAHADGAWPRRCWDSDNWSLEQQVKGGPLRTVLARLEKRGIQCRIVQKLDTKNKPVYAYRGRQTTYILPNLIDIAKEYDNKGGDQSTPSTKKGGDQSTPLCDQAEKGGDTSPEGGDQSTPSGDESTPLRSYPSSTLETPLPTAEVNSPNAGASEGEGEISSKTPEELPRAFADAAKLIRNPTLIIPNYDAPIVVARVDLDPAEQAPRLWRDMLGCSPDLRTRHIDHDVVVAAIQAALVSGASSRQVREAITGRSMEGARDLTKVIARRLDDLTVAPVIPIRRAEPAAETRTQQVDTPVLSSRGRAAIEECRRINAARKQAGTV